MTDNEIIKALKCCGDENNCAECPLNGTRFELDMSCANELMKASAELIKSLKSEKDFLINMQEVLLKHISSQNEDIASCNSEIDRLKSKLEPQGFEKADTMDFCGVLCDFAEKLIEKQKRNHRPFD